MFYDNKIKSNKITTLVQTQQVHKRSILRHEEQKQKYTLLRVSDVCGCVRVYAQTDFSFSSDQISLSPPSLPENTRLADSSIIVDSIKLPY